MEAAGLADGVKNADDYGGGEDEPDDGDALEKPIDRLQHEISREILSPGSSAGGGSFRTAERTGLT